MFTGIFFFDPPIFLVKNLPQVFSKYFRKLYSNFNDYTLVLKEFNLLLEKVKILKNSWLK